MLGQLIAKCNELVEKHNALDIAFVKERRALQSDIKWYKEELQMMHKNMIRKSKEKVKANA
ncbi:hypothetical protein ES707_10315 [subsurface metagenome]